MKVVDHIQLGGRSGEILTPEPEALSAEDVERARKLAEEHPGAKQDIRITRGDKRVEMSIRWGVKE